MRRWGQIAEPKADSWFMDMAQKVYRPDIYAVAAKELIAEGKVDAKDFPDFATETGYKSPQTEFIDGITFDGTKPNAYLQQFPIGLKGEEVVE
jgi:nitrate/nitrite transport system substrate-binding protein